MHAEFVNKLPLSLSHKLVLLSWPRHRSSFSQGVYGTGSQKEKREAELSHRVQELEQRAHAADERLASAGKALKLLAGLGLSPDDFPGFAQRIAKVAQQHGVKPSSLRDRLLHELEQLEAGMGLESLLEKRQQELTSIEQAIAEAHKERAALESAIQELAQQKESLTAAISEERGHVSKEMRAIADIARKAQAKLSQDLQHSVHETILEVEKLSTKAFDLGQELGHCKAIVEANEWVSTLAALVKGDGDISTGEVRAAGLTVLRALDAWLRQHHGTISHHYPLKTYLDSAIKELEQWKV